MAGCVVAAFASAAFSVSAFSPAAFSFDVVVTQQPSGNFGYAVHLRRYDKQTPEQIHAERVKLGIFKPDEVAEAESLVSAVIESRTTEQKQRDTEAELQAVEDRFRAWLDEAQREWTREFIILLAASYAKIEQENTDMQIVLLLWDM